MRTMGQTIRLNKGATRDGKGCEYDVSTLRQIDAEDGRTPITGDEARGVVELEAAVETLDDSIARLEKHHKKNGHWTMVKAARGMLHKVCVNTLNTVQLEQAIGICNQIDQTEMVLVAKNQAKPDLTWAIETKSLTQIARQAIRMCQMTCTKTRKQAKNCAIRRALMQVPGMADAAVDNPLLSDDQCIFCQIGADVGDS